MRWWGERSAGAEVASWLSWSAPAYGPWSSWSEARSWAEHGEEQPGARGARRPRRPGSRGALTDLPSIPSGAPCLRLPDDKLRRSIERVETHFALPLIAVGENHLLAVTDVGKGFFQRLEAMFALAEQADMLNVAIEQGILENA